MVAGLPQPPPASPRPPAGLAEGEKGERQSGSATAAVVVVLILRTVRGNPPALQGGTVDLTGHRSGGRIRLSQGTEETTNTRNHKHPDDDQQDSRRVAARGKADRSRVSVREALSPREGTEPPPEFRQCLIDVNYGLRNASHSSTPAGSLRTEMTRFSGITLE